jgi:lipopolysaccharide export system permease protein
MRILSRYVLREFLLPLVYCLTGFFSIYVLFELFGSFGRLVEARLPASETVAYFLGYLSPFFMWLAPAALMLATLYTMWNFCRHSEIVAMRASGISFMTIVRPLLGAAFAMALAVAWVNECYVPAHAPWAKRLRAERFAREKIARMDNIVYRNSQSRRFWTAEGLEESASGAIAFTGVRVVCDRPHGGGQEMTLEAARADYLDGEWWFTRPVVRRFDADGRERPSATPDLDALTFRVFPEFNRDRPGDILMQNRGLQYSSVRDKLRFVRRHASELRPDTRRECLYDAWAQAVAPLACLVITLFAIPAGIASGRQSVFKGIVGALVMFFGYYGAAMGAMACAYKGWLPPPVAAFLPAAVFLALGIRSFRRQR